MVGVHNINKSASTCGVLVGPPRVAFPRANSTQGMEVDASAPCVERLYLNKGVKRVNLLAFEYGVTLGSIPWSSHINLLHHEHITHCLIVHVYFYAYAHCIMKLSSTILPTYLIKDILCHIRASIVSLGIMIMCICSSTWMSWKPKVVYYCIPTWCCFWEHSLNRPRFIETCIDVDTSCVNLEVFWKFDACLTNDRLHEDEQYYN